ncbi:MAG: glycosyltransferase family 4 protein [Acidobacteriota bacterium]
MSIRTFYICYFSLREPLVQTQVLPYLRELKQSDIEISILTFEPNFKNSWAPSEKQEWKTRLAAEGINWHALPYHKRVSLLATFYDIAMGAFLLFKLRKQIDVLHARSHVAAAVGSIAKRFIGCPLIFDIRGFFPEEYVDAGIWTGGGFIYRLTKFVEKRLFAAADAFVVLTGKARDILFGEDATVDEKGRPIEVIPCCVDLGRFQPVADLDKEAVRAELGLTGRRVLVYVGALGGWYLTREMAEFLATAHEKNPNSFSLILTQSPPAMIADEFKKLKIPENDYLIKQVAPAEIPRYLKTADLAISFIKPCYSKLASSPTKLAEYLASGLPVIANGGIGDVDDVLQNDRVGVVINEFTASAYRKALREAEQLLQDKSAVARCRESAMRNFNLEEVGGMRYRRLYHRLLEIETKKFAASEVIS